VPKRARWSEIQKVATNIGEALNKAALRSRTRTRSSKGVLAGIDFNDERKLGDARNRDVVLGGSSSTSPSSTSATRTSPSPTCSAAPTST
jgi:hypothetical protein